MDIPDNPRDITAPQRCPRCGYTWDVLGLHEHGVWSPYNEDDLDCPDCGRDLMEEDAVKIDKETAKKIATDFYYWWHNQPGTNTQQGFDEYWEKYYAKSVQP